MRKTVHLSFLLASELINQTRAIGIDVTYNQLLLLFENGVLENFPSIGFGVEFHLMIIIFFLRLVGIIRNKDGYKLSSIRIGQLQEP